MGKSVKTAVELYRVNSDLLNNVSEHAIFYEVYKG